MHPVHKEKNGQQYRTLKYPDQKSKKNGHIAVHCEYAHAEQVIKNLPVRLVSAS